MVNNYNTNPYRKNNVRFNQTNMRLAGANITFANARKNEYEYLLQQQNARENTAINRATEANDPILSVGTESTDTIQKQEPILPEETQQIQTDHIKPNRVSNVKSSVKQDSKLSKQSQLEIENIDQQIFEQRGLIRKLEDQIKKERQANASNTQGMIAIPQADPKTDKALRDAKKELQDLEQKKNLFVGIISENQVASLAKNYISNYIQNNETYLQEEAARKKLYDQQEKATTPQEHKRLTFEANELRKKYAQRDQKLGLLEQYLSQNFVANIEDIPAYLRDTAKRYLTTKDGKLVLKDEEFRKGYYEATVYSDKDINSVIKYAKEAADNYKFGENDDIKMFRQELEIEKEALELKRKTMASASTGIARGMQSTITSSQELDRVNIANKAAKQEQEKINTAIKLLDKAVKHKTLNDEIMAREEQNTVIAGFKNVGTTLREFFSDTNTYTLHAPDLKIASQLYHLSDKLLDSGIDKLDKLSYKTTDVYDKLSSGEKDILKAQVLEQMYHSAYGDYENVNSYKWGNIAAESLLFMAQFMATGFLASGIEGAAKSGANITAKWVANQLAKHGAENLTKRMLVAGARRGLGKYALQPIARIAADAGYATFLANSLGAPKTYADSFELAAGNITGNLDKRGQVHVDLSALQNSKMDLFDASMISQKRNFVENFSEMMGAWGAGKFTKALTKDASVAIGRATGSTKFTSLGNYLKTVERAQNIGSIRKLRTAAEKMITDGGKLNFGSKIPFNIKGLPTVESLQKIAKAGQYHGFFGEVAEEYYGIALNHLLGTEERPTKEGESWMSSLLNDMTEQTMDIWGGIGVSTAMLGVLGSGRYMYHQLRYKMAESELYKRFAKDTADAIRSKLLFSKKGDIAATANALMKAIATGKTYDVKHKAFGVWNKHDIGKQKIHQDDESIENELTQTQKQQMQALLDYYGRLMGVRGSVIARDVLTQGISDRYEKHLEKAHEDGYTLGDWETKRVMQDVVDVLKTNFQSVADLQIDQDSNILDRYENDEMTERQVIDYLRNEKKYSDDVVSQAYAYFNALRFSKATDEFLADSINIRAQRTANIVNDLKYQGDAEDYQGYTVPIMLDNGQQVFLISGNLRKRGASSKVIADSNEYTNDEDKSVVVSTVDGQRRKMNIEDLEGAEFGIMTNAADMYNGILTTSRLQQMVKESRYLDGKDLPSGKVIQLDDNKILTVMHSSDARGITFSISNEDGSDLQIQHVQDPKDFKDFLSKATSKKVIELTKFFNEDALKVIEQERNDKIEEWRKNNPAPEETQVEESSEEEEPTEETVSEENSGSEEEAPVEEAPVETPDEEAPSESPSEEPEDEEAPAEAPVEEQPIEEAPAEEEPAEAPRTEGALPHEEPTPKLEPKEVTPQQQAALDQLQTIAEQTQSKKVATTGWNYFIEDEDGILKIWRRVHSVIGSRRKNLDESIDQQNLKKSIKERLEKVFKDADLSSENSIRKAIKRFVNDVLQEKTQKLSAKQKTNVVNYFNYSLNLETYLDYLIDNIHDEKEVNEVFEGISSILSENLPNLSTVAGGIIDTICRYYFDYNRTAPLAYDDSKLTVTIYGQENIHISDEYEFENGTKRQLMSEKVFNQIIGQLNVIKQYYESQGLRLVCATPLNLHGTFLYGSTNVVRVAGETDAIAVDEKGNYQIVDFKTYKYDLASRMYHQETVNDMMYNEFTEEYEPSTSVYGTENDFFKKQDEKDTSKYGNDVMLYSLASQYARQLAMYNMMFPTTVDGSISTKSSILMMGINYDYKDDVISFVEDEDGAPHTQRMTVPIDPTKPVATLDDPDVAKPNIFYINYEGADATEEIKESIKDLLGTIRDIHDQEFMAEVSILNDMTFAILDDYNKQFKEQIKQFNGAIEDLISRANQAVTDQQKADIKQEMHDLIDQHDEIQSTIADMSETARQHQEFYDKLNRAAQKYVDSLSDGAELEKYIIRTINDVYTSHGMLINADGDIDVDEINNGNLNDQLLVFIANDLLCRYTIEKVQNESGSSLSQHLQQKIAEYKEFIEGLATELSENGIEYGSYTEQLMSTIVQDEQDEEEYVKRRKDYSGLYNNSTNKPSVVQSHAEGDESDMLSEAMKESNFIEEARFELRPTVDVNNKITGYEITVVYNGKNYTPVELYIAPDDKLPVEKGGNGALSELLYGHDVADFEKKFNGRVITVNNDAISRTNGEIQNQLSDETDPTSRVYRNMTDEYVDESGKKHAPLVSKERGEGIYLYDVEYSGNQTQFGITRSKFVYGKVRVSVAIPGSSDANARSNIFTYSNRNPNTRPSKGTVVMMHKLPFTEYLSRNEEAPVVPINMETQTISENDARFIYDIITGKYLSDADKRRYQETGDINVLLSSRFYDNGILYDLSNMDLINMFITYGDNTAHLRMVTDGKTIKLIGNIEGVSKTENKKRVGILNEFNIETEGEEFVKFVSTYVKANISEQFSMYRLNDNVDNFFKNLKSSFDKERRRLGKKQGDFFTLQFGNSSLKFDTDDFTSDRKSGKKAISGFGWYIKNGFVKTSYIGFNQPLITVDMSGDWLDYGSTEQEVVVSEATASLSEGPVVVVEQTEEGEEEVVVSTAEVEGETAPNLYDGESTTSGLALSSTTTLDEYDASAGLINEQDARQVLREILGFVDVKFEDEFLSVVGNRVTLGRCYASFIQLSRKATPGTEYHEAFHMIVELLMTNEQRKKAYKEYKENFKKKNNTTKELSNKEAAEGLAEQFKYFALERNKIGKIKSWNIVKMFRKLLQYYKLFKEIGNLRLFNMYRAAKNGKFQNVNPTTETIRRFNQFAKKGYLAMDLIKHGHALKTMFTDEEYDAVIRSLNYILLHSATQTVEDGGRNIQSVKHDLNTMLQSPTLLNICGYSVKNGKLYRTSNAEYGQHGIQAIAEILGLVVKNDDFVVQKVQYKNGTVVYRMAVDEKVSLWNDVQEEIMADLRQFQMNPTSEAQRLIDEQRRKTEENYQDPSKESGAPSLEEKNHYDPTKDEDMIIENGNPKDHTADSAEFDPITRASGQVKFFFSRIADVTDVPVETNGVMHNVPKFNLNMMGLPQFVDFKDTWKKSLIRLHDVESTEQLFARLQNLANTDRMFKQIYDRFKNLVLRAYDFTWCLTDGKTDFTNWQDERIKVKDYNAEKLIAEIYCAVKGALVDRQVLESFKTGTEKDEAGSVKSQSTDLKYMAQQIRSSWTNLVASGESRYIGIAENGMYELKNESESLKYSSTIFKSVGDLLDSFVDIINGKKGKLNIEFTSRIFVQVGSELEQQNRTLVNRKVNPDDVGVHQLDLTNDTHVLAVKEWFVDQLNDLGISINIAHLDSILSNRYGSISTKALAQFLVDTNFDKFTAGVRKINIMDKGQIGTIWDNTKQYYEFISQLSQGVYDYMRSESQLSVLTIAGKKLYLISENNTITDRLDEIQSNVNVKLFDNLTKDPFYSVETDRGLISSRVFSALQQDEHRPNLQYIAICGFKTDNIGSEGVEYTQLSDVEDYIAKYALLAQNLMISPTMADKTSWGAIKYSSTRSRKSAYNEEVFGFDYGYNEFNNSFSKNSIAQSVHAENLRTLDSSRKAYSHDRYEDGTLHVHLPISVLRQFNAYAHLEYESARRELEHYNKLKSEGREAEFHENFEQSKYSYTIGGETHYVVQGARFSTFTEIVRPDGTRVSLNTLGTPIYKKKNGEIVYDEFDNPVVDHYEYKDEAANIKTAEEEFFNFDEDEDYQLAIIERLLSEQIEAELEDLADKGIVEEKDGDYLSKMLDSTKISKIATWLSDKETSVKKKNKNSDEEESTHEVKTQKPSTAKQKSDAIIGYVADMVVKSQMSLQEIARVYYGNLCFYAWNYDETTGELLDTTQDLFKRIGSLVSTGTNNFLSYPGAKEEYTCAEIMEVKTDPVFSQEFEDEFRHAAWEQELQQLLERTRFAKFFVQNKDEENGGHYGIKYDDLTNPETKYQVEKYIAKTKAEIKEFVEKSREDIAAEIQRVKDVDSAKKEAKKKNPNITKAELDEIEKKYGPKIISVIQQQCIDECGEDITKETLGIVAKKANALNHSKTKIADGATYITADMTKELLRQCGKFGEEERIAFDILTKGEYSYYDDKKKDRVTVKYDITDMRVIASAYNKIYTTVIGMQKYTAYGQRPININSDTYGSYVLNATYSDKTALAPIFDCMATGYLGLISQKMKEDGVDMLKVHSAIKVGGRGQQRVDDVVAQKWIDDVESYKHFHFNTYTQRYKDIRKQFNTDPKHSDTMSFGTQAMKVILDALGLGMEFNIKEADGTIKTYNSTEMRDEIMECLRQLTDCGRDLFELRFFNDDGSLNEKEFSKLLRSELSRRDANSELLSAIDTDSNGKMKLNLAAMSGTNWIQSILASILNKNIIDVVTPGAAFYQRSIFGMEGNNMEFSKKDGGIITQNNFIDPIYNGNRLQEKNEEGSMDCVLSIDYFDYLFDQHQNLKGQSFEAKKQWLINNNIISGFKYQKDENGEYVNIDGAYVRYDLYKNKGNGKYASYERYSRGEWNNATANIVGYRIPTQAVSSIHAMRCVDVVNTVRHTIILPSQVTSVTGSDFDIDKFFLSTINYENRITPEGQQKFEEFIKTQKVIDAVEKALAEAQEKKGSELTEEERNRITLREQRFQAQSLLKPYRELSSDFSKELDEDSSQKDKLQRASKYYQNRLIKLQLEILKNSGNNIAKLHGSIDSDTAPIERMAKDVIGRRYGKSKVRAFDATSLRLHTRAKLQFAGGKTGIAPFALNNNSHALTMMYGVKFKHDEGGILGILELEDLSKSHDRNGHSIMSWMSGLINAHVDVAKDPYIGMLNVNQYTYNLTNLLLRTGYGEETFLFLDQPIVRQFARANKLASGVYMQDEEQSLSTRQDEKVDEVYFNFMSKNFGITLQDRDSVREQFIENVLKKEKEYRPSLSYKDAITSLMKHKSGVKVLEHIASSNTHRDKYTLYLDETRDPVTGEVTRSGEFEMTYEEIQGLVGIATFELLEKSKGLSNLVQYTKIDTKKHGKNMTEQSHYLEKMNELLSEEKSPFEHDGIERMLKNSFIEHKTVESIGMMRRVLGYQLYEGTSAFSEQIHKMTDILNSSNSSADYVRSVEKMLLAHIKAQYFFGPNGYCQKRHIDPADIMGGRNSIYNRLVKIQSQLNSSTDHSLDYLKAANGRCKNYLIDTLICGDVISFDMVSRLMSSNTSVDDDWSGAKFVQNRNIFDDSIKSNYIKNAWASLLMDSEHPEMQKFAEDLIVYAFMTSCDNGGKFDLFKFVPESWRLGNKLMFDTPIQSYGEWSREMLQHYQNNDESIQLTDEDIDEMVLNHAWDNNIVKTISSKRIDKCVTMTTDILQLTDKKYGRRRILFIGGIDNNGTLMFKDEPGYIKIETERNTNTSAKCGQGLYDIYKKVGYGLRKKNDKSGDTVKYPIYALVAPRGGKYAGGQKIYDFGLSHTTNDRKFYATYSKVFDILRRNFVNRGQASGISSNYVEAGPFAILEELVNTRMRLPKDLSDSNIQDNLATRILRFNYLDTDRKAIYKSQQLDILSQFAQDMADQLNVEPSEFGGTNEYAIRVRERVSAYDAANTNIDLSDDNRYQQVKTVSAAGFSNSEFMQQAVESVLQERKGVHLQYYKKRVKQGGKEYYAPTIVISLNNQSYKGYFEINQQFNGESKILTDTYDVSFKTADAEVPMSAVDKQYLFDSLIRLIPMNHKLTMSAESITQEEIEAVNSFGNRSSEWSGYMNKVGSKPINESSEEEVPIWQKSDRKKNDIFLPKKKIAPTAEKKTGPKRASVEVQIPTNIVYSVKHDYGPGFVVSQDLRFLIADLISLDDKFANIEKTLVSAIQDLYCNNKEARTMLANTGDADLVINPLLTESKMSATMKSMINVAKAELERIRIIAQAEQASKETLEGCK